MPAKKFLQGGGEMGEITRNVNWAQTPLGTPDTWPQSLRTTVSIILSSKFPMFLFWGDEQICFYNDAYRPSLGNEGKHPCVGKKGKDVWPEIWPVIKPLIDQVLAGGDATWSEDQLIPIFRNGKMEDVYWTFSYSPVKEESGNIAGIFVTCVETTSKVVTVQKLQLSDQRFQNLIREATVGLIVLSGKEMRVDIVNNEYGKLIDKKPAELLNKNLFEIIPETEEHFRPILENVLVTGESLYLYDHPYFVFVNEEKKAGYLDLVYQPYKELDGTITGVMVVCQDVTEQVLSRKKIEQSEQRLRSVIEEAPIPMCLYTGKEMKIEIINDSLLKTWGRDKSVIGKTLKDAIPELEGQPFLKLLDDVYTSGVPYSVHESESKVLIDGILTTHFFDLWYKPMMDENGKVYGVLASGVDITDKIFSRRNLEESEQNLRNVILQAPAAMCILKGPLHIVEIANDRMFELWGKKAGDILNKPIFEGLSEAKGQGFEELLNSVYNTGETIRAYEIPVTLPRSTGIELVYVNFVYEAFKEVNGNISGVMAVAIEVTEQVEVRQKLEASEERLRIAIDAAELGTFELDYSNPDEMITTNRFDELFGFDKNVSRHEYANVIHPEDIHIRNNAHAESLVTGKLFYEVRVIKKDGKISWVRVVGKVIFNNEGKAERLLGILQDTSEQKDLQQQKDNFIAMASHELKTPVTSIKAYAQILEQMLLKKGDIKEAGMVSRMDAQINRLTNLISDLLNITRINSGRLEYHKTNFAFNELVNEMAEELQRTTNTHKLIVNLNENVKIFSDKERIGQVITNLLSNAIKYSPEADKVNISSKVDNNQVTFCVEDFGIGINIESVGKVFEQFYRVNNDRHQTFQGLGLGLYISSEIIRNEGGKIWVNSVEGKGSEFCFSLPLSKEKI